MKPSTVMNLGEFLVKYGNFSKFQRFRRQKCVTFANFPKNFPLFGAKGAE